MRKWLVVGALLLTSWGGMAWMWTHPRVIVMPAGTVSTQNPQSQPAQMVKPVADSMGGKVIGAVTVYVPVRDTVVIHDTLVTVDSGGTRTASFRDSTFAGVVEGNVVAPPAPAPLRMAYTLTRPAFTPTVGLIQVGTEVSAVVRWQGEEARVDGAFALPQAPRPKRVQPFVQGSYGWTSRLIDAEGGLLVHLPQGVSAAPSYRWVQQGGSEIRLGIRKVW